MASFNVVVRGGYRDVGGLALDCSPGDFVLGASDRVERWRNRAPLRVGVPKFGDLVKQAGSPAAEHPTKTPEGGARFVRADHTTLFAESLGDFGAAGTNWTFAWDMAKGSVATNDQVILGVASSAAFRAYRRKSNDQTIFTSTSSASASGDMGDGVTMLAFNPAGTFDLRTNNASVIASGTCSPFTFLPNETFALNVGRREGGGDYLDATLYRVVGWRRQLSPLERDLAHRDLSGVGTNLSAQTRATVALKVWHDGTADPAKRQVSRLRPMVGAQPLYFEVTRHTGAARVQLACEVGDSVLPDTGLAGALFTGSVVERAGPVTFFQDAGWSSVFDVEVRRAGHYALLFARPGHGGRVVHFDVV